MGSGRFCLYLESLAYNISLLMSWMWIPQLNNQVNAGVISGEGRNEGGVGWGAGESAVYAPDRQMFSDVDKRQR